MDKFHQLYRPSINNPAQLNDFLASVHQHSSDFKWLRELGNVYEERRQNRLIKDDSSYKESPGPISRRSSVFHRGGMMRKLGDRRNKVNRVQSPQYKEHSHKEKLKYSKRNSVPANDLYPYMYENEEFNLPSLANPHQRNIRRPIPHVMSPKMQKLNRLRRNTHRNRRARKREISARVNTRSDYGNVAVSGEKLPGRKIAREAKLKLPNSLDEINLRDYSKDIPAESNIQEVHSGSEESEAINAENLRQAQNNKANNNRENDKKYNVKNNEDEIRVHTVEPFIDADEITRNIGVFTVDDLLREKLKQKGKKREMKVEILENGKVVQEYAHKDNNGALVVDFRASTEPGSTSSFNLDTKTDTETPTTYYAITTPTDSVFKQPDNDSVSEINQNADGRSSDQGTSSNHELNKNPLTDQFYYQGVVHNTNNNNVNPNFGYMMPIKAVQGGYEDKSNYQNYNSMNEQNDTTTQKVTTQKVASDLPYFSLSGPHMSEKGFEKVVGLEVDSKSNPFSEENRQVSQIDNPSPEKDFQKRNYEEFLKDVFRQKLMRKITGQSGQPNREVAPQSASGGLGAPNRGIQRRNNKADSYVRINPSFFATANDDGPLFGERGNVNDNEALVSTEPNPQNDRENLDENDEVSHNNVKKVKEFNAMSKARLHEHGSQMNKASNVNKYDGEFQSGLGVSRLTEKNQMNKAKYQNDSSIANERTSAMVEPEGSGAPGIISEQVFFPIGDIIKSEMLREKLMQFKKERGQDKVDTSMSYDKNRFPVSKFIKQQMKTGQYEELINKLHNLDDINYAGYEKHPLDDPDIAANSKVEPMDKRNILLEQEDFEELNNRKAQDSKIKNFREMLMDMARAKRQFRHNQVDDGIQRFDPASYIPSRQLKSISEDSSSQLHPHARKKRSYREFFGLDTNDEDYYEDDSSLQNKLAKRKEPEYSDEQDTDTGKKINEYTTIHKKTSNALANPSINDSSKSDESEESTDDEEDSKAELNSEQIKTCKTCSKNRQNKAKQDKQAEDLTIQPETESEAPKVEHKKSVHQTKKQKRKEHRKKHSKKHRHHKHRATFKKKKKRTEKKREPHGDAIKLHKQSVKLQHEDKGKYNDDQIVSDDLILLQASMVEKDVQKLINEDETFLPSKFNKRSSRKSRLVLVPLQSLGMSRQYAANSWDRPNNVELNEPYRRIFLDELDSSYNDPHFQSRKLQSVEQPTLTEESDNNEPAKAPSSSKNYPENNKIHQKMEIEVITEEAAAEADEDSDDDDEDDSEHKAVESKLASNKIRDTTTEAVLVIDKDSQLGAPKKLISLQKRIQPVNEKEDDADYDYDDDTEEEVSSSGTCKNCKHPSGNKDYNDERNFARHRATKKKHPQNIKNLQIGAAEYEEGDEDAVKLENAVPFSINGVKYVPVVVSTESEVISDESMNPKEVIRRQNFEELFKKHPWIKMDNLEQAPFDFAAKNIGKRSSEEESKGEAEECHHNDTESCDEAVSLVPILQFKTEDPKEANIIKLPSDMTTTSQCTKATTCGGVASSTTQEAAVSGLEEVENGHIASSIVLSVLKQVHDNANLHKFCGGLGKKNTESARKIHFDMLQCADSKQELEESQELLHSIKDVLSKLVMNQIQRRMCQHLPKELKNYIVTITSCGSSASEIEKKQKQNDMSNTLDNEQTNYLFASEHANNTEDNQGLPDQLNNKIEVCEGLLKKYNKLDDECKDKAEPVKEYVEKHLHSAKNMLECEQKNQCEGEMAIEHQPETTTECNDPDESHHMHSQSEEHGKEHGHEENCNESMGDDHVRISENPDNILGDNFNQGDNSAISPDYESHPQEGAAKGFDLDVSNENVKTDEHFQKHEDENKNDLGSNNQEQLKGSKNNNGMEGMVEHELESVGLGKSHEWRPNFSLDQMVKTNLNSELDTGRLAANTLATEEKKCFVKGKYKRDSNERSVQAQSAKYKKLADAIEKMKQKHEGDALIGELYGGNKEERKRSVDDDDYPSMRNRNREMQEQSDAHFEEPLVYSMH